MFLFRSINLKLNSKIVLLCAGLVLLTTIVIQASTWFVTNQFYQQELRSNVDNAKEVLKQYLAAQEDLLITAAGVLTADFGFIRAVATSDADTIQSALSNHGSRINADLMVLLDRNGHAVASASDTLSNTEIETIETSSFQAQPQVSNFFVINNKVFQLILLPVRAPHTIGHILMGFEIRVDNLIQLQRLTGMDVNLFSGDTHLLSTKLRLDSFEKFRNMIEKQSSPWLFIDRPAYMSEEVPLNSPADSPVFVMLTHSLQPIYKQYDDITWNNTLLAFIVGLFAILLSMALAKGLTTQLAKLTDLADAFARGDYKEDIKSLSGSIEVRRLTKAFLRMGRQVEQREAKISFQARHDLITGLYNAYTFNEHLIKALGAQHPMLIATINIQNFRQINDRLGIEIADSCMKLMANRLVSLNRQNPMLFGKLDGAEFVVSLPYNTDKQQPIKLVEQLMEYLAQDCVIESIKIRLSLIAGVAMYPEDGNVAETLIRRAHIALDNAREKKLTLHHYEEGEDEAHLERISIIEALKRVISMESQDELYMAYQPKIRRNHDEPLSVESLIRWQRKDVGFVSPEVFIDVAEQSGLIIELTQWVFETVVEQVSDWLSDGIEIYAAVNVSSQDLLHQDFISFVTTSCERFNVDPKYITIEITERDIMHDEAHALVRLIELKKAGFQIALDDYGIGQSSLSKLKELPLDKIKIDKAFIQQIDRSKKDQLIVKSTIEMAHGLGFKVVAEGVENADSVAFLDELNCDYLQGYFISKPIVAEQLIQWQKNYVEDTSFFES